MEANKQQFEFIHHLWHRLAACGNIEKLMGLYDEDAILSSPLVPMLLNQKSLQLKGYSEIYNFLAKCVQHRLADVVKRDLSGYSLIENDLLVCEYSRQTTESKQATTLEMLNIKSGKIYQHRIYWI